MMATKDFFLVHTTSVLLFRNRKAFNILDRTLYKHSNTMQSKVVSNSTLEGVASSMAHKLC